MAEQIAVLGAGSWGSTLANMLVENGHDVKLWSRNQEQVDQLNNEHVNPHYMKDLVYSDKLVATSDMADAVKGAQVILIVIPTKGLRQVAGQLNKILEQNNQRPLIVHATKGLEQNTYKRPSEMLMEEINEENRRDIVVLSGPSHAEDLSLIHI